VPEDLYEPPGEQISQGDIFRSAAHLYLGRHVQVLTSESSGTYRATAVSDGADRSGDTHQVLAVAKFGLGIMITQDCEIDKPNRRWIVCPIVRSDRLSPTVREKLRTNSIFSMLFLPAYRDLLPDSFIDFNQASTLDPEFVRGLPRVLSLSDLGRRALYVQYIRWLSRWVFHEINCPACGLQFNPTLVLPVRQPPD